MSRATEPIDIALLVDNSTAAADEIIVPAASLSTFVERMAPGNQIAVITLADRPTIRVDYTDDAARLQGVGEQPVLDAAERHDAARRASSRASTGLRKRETPRAVIVPVITDGVEFTNTYFRDVVNALVTSQRGAAHGDDRAVLPRRRARHARALVPARRRARANRAASA